MSLVVQLDISGGLAKRVTDYREDYYLEYLPKNILLQIKATQYLS